LVYKFVEKLHLAVNEYKALNGTGLVVWSFDETKSHWLFISISYDLEVACSKQ
jgi:hypothetical protein